MDISSSKTDVHPINFINMNKSTIIVTFMLFLFGITSSTFYAQSMEERQMEPFTSLDLAQVSTGLLMDQALGYVNIPGYNGQQLVDSLSLTGLEFPFLYSMIQRSHVDSSELSNVVARKT